MRLCLPLLALVIGWLPSAVAQSNDNFAGRLTLGGAEATAVSNNLSATREAGEPNHAGSAAGRSLWWTWTAPTSGVVNFSTFCGSIGVTPPRTLAVYTGSAVASLTEVGSSNDFTSYYPLEFVQNANLSATGTSLNIAVTAGTTYQIAVDATAGFPLVDDGTVVLGINTPPTIVSAASVNAATGAAFQYNILASNGPTVYGTSNLPPGLSLNPANGQISGVPAADGTYTIGISATGPGGTGTATLTLQASDPAPAVVLPPVLNGGAGATGCVGTAFSYFLSATGNPTSYTVANLPPGLSFSSSNGEITGTPTAAGTFAVPITATNAAGTGSALVTITIASVPLPPIFDGNLTASTTVGSAFSYYIYTTSEGPAGTVTGYTATGLPPGLSLSSSNVISGTATQAGVYPVAVSATNAGGTRSATVTITVNPAVTTPVPATAPPQLFSSAAATGTVGTAFSYPLSATNTPTGFGASNLPPGLSLDTGSGAITGTPTAAGTFTVPVTASNTFGVSTATLTITVFANAAAQRASNPPLAPVITSPVMVAGYTGQSLAYALTATYNGQSSYYSQGTWLFSATGLPPGLTLNTFTSGNNTTASITGTPTAAGTYQAAVSATFTSTYPYPVQPAATTTAVVTFLIKPGPIIPVPTFTNAASLSMPAGTALTIYPSVTGSPTSFTASGLPPGLSINASSGSVTGTPTTAGTYQATFTGTNSVGTGNAVVEYIVTQPTAPLVTSAATAAGVVGTAFTYTVAASPSATAFSAASLPPGLACNTATGVISGTPTAAGVYTVPLSATNAVGTGSATLTVTITATSNAAIPLIYGDAAVQGTVGTSFDYYLDATNSPTSYSASTLPPGLTLDSYGDIEGTPTAAGTYTVPISATNAAGTAHATLTIIIATLPVPVLSSSAVVNATVNTSFSYYISASNSPTSYAASGLPSGATLNTSTGYLSGTLATAGSYPVTISAINASGSGSATLTINVVPVPAPVLPVVGGAAGATGVVGSAFSYAVQASGNPTGYAMSSVPAGLSFNTSTGVLSGTPTVAGTYPLTFTATNATGTGQAALNLVVSSTPSSAPVITSAAQLLVWQRQTFYYVIATSPAAASYTASNLPTGLTLNASTGLISGTLSSTGTYTVPVTATNTVGTTSATLTITVVTPSVAVATNPAAVSAIVGQTFNTTLTASGSAIYSSSASPLPTGLSLNSSTGAISGTPSAVGSTSATTSQYTNLGYANAKLLIAVSSAAPTVPVISSAAGVGAYTGFPLTYFLQATNSPTAFAASGLPPGLTLNASTGLVSGTPTAAGSYPVTVGATNAKGTSGSATMTVTITTPPISLLQLTSAASVTGVVGAPLNYTTTAGAYNSPNEFFASNLPPGLSINAGTGLISGTPTLSGVYSTTLTAENYNGYSCSAVVTFNITATPTAVPVLTSPAGAGGIVGTVFSYTVAASNAVTLGVSGLPGGLSFNPATGVISGTPTASGTFSIPLTAANSLGQGSAALTLAVAATPPAAPTLTTSNPLVRSYTLGDSASASIYAIGNPITYAASNLPPGLSINTATGAISGTLTTAGTYPVTVSAANGAGSASAVIAYVVAPVTAVPVFNYLDAESTGDTGISFGTVYLDASGSPTGYAVSGLPPGLTLNPVNGAVTGTPTAAGTYPVNVSATNAAGTGSAVWTVVINDTSTFRPVFYSTKAAVSAAVGQVFADNCEVTSVGAGTSLAEPLSFTYSGLPPGISGNASDNYYADLSGTPTAAGVYPVTITATTPAGISASEVVTLVITSATPAITSPAGAAGNVGSAFSYALTSASTISTYAASGLPPGLTLNPTTGAITGTPTTAGTYTVPVTAVGITGTGSAVVTFLIGAPTFGGLPVITSAAEANCQDVEATSYGYFPPYLYNTAASSYTITAINLPGSFGASNLPAGLSLNPYTGVITGQPLVSGIFQVPITATNAVGTCGATLTILTTATVPTIASSLIVNGVAGTPFYGEIETTSATADDLIVYEEVYGFNSDPLTFAATGLAPGLSLNTVTGAITGTPTQTGTFPVAVSATNRAGTGSAVMTIVITSTPPSPTTPPIFEGEDMAAGFVGFPLSYSLSGYVATSYAATGLPAGLSLNPATGYITGTPTQTGTFSVPVSATNAVGTAQAVLTIAVDAVPPAPYIYSDADASAVVSTPFVYAIVATSSGGPAITSYGAGNVPAGLSFNAQTGQIIGTPTGPTGTFQVPISASIGAVTGNATLTLMIQPATTSSSQPALATSAGALGFTANPLVYALGGTGFAPASAVPDGLTFDVATGTITGYPAAAGTYQIPLATSGASSGGTAVLTLNVLTPDLSLPRLTGQPAGATVLQNGSVTFNVAAVGSPSPIYQWARNGVPLAGATAATLTLTELQPSDAGTYTLTAANAAGQVVSGPAVLKVQQTYATWRAAHFTTAEINTGSADDGNDLTGDGVPNLLKYALGIDPITGTGGSLPVATYAVADGALQLAFTRDTARSDIDYVVEASPDLKQWTAIASSTFGSPTASLGGASTVIENGVPGTSQVSVVVESSQSANTLRQQFLRLKVVRP